MRDGCLGGKLLSPGPGPVTTDARKEQEDCVFPECVPGEGWGVLLCQNSLRYQLLKSIFLSSVQISISVSAGGAQDCELITTAPLPSPEVLMGSLI